ncbi:PDR/VanB family oxidoreductase [Nocardia sp. NPDC059240]|uniref:PDR/VanB family oxidoreductase n=1 Tax=Nocardia sp. NPDC059240 TaxID=3346786 RepID=UPI0036AE57D5
MRELRLATATLRTPTVRELILVDPVGAPLPSFAPGSHIAVEVPGGRRNSYSLTGPAVAPGHYAISVRREREGHGGSRELHELPVGATLSVSAPRSDFPPVAAARHHLFVAGGIGITPLLSHVRAAVEWGRSFALHYVSRPDDIAHLDELRELCGTRLIVHAGRAALWSELGPALRDQPLGTHLYTCGPAALIDEVHARAIEAGWPAQRLHAERFAAAFTEPGAPFAAKLGRSGLLVKVAPEATLLDALLAKGIRVPNLCRQGVCGECRLGVRGGGIEHRDHYLTEDERAAGDALMACVSRATGDLLELEL